MKKRVNLFSQRTKLVLGGKFLSVGTRVVKWFFFTNLALILLGFGLLFYLNLNLKDLSGKQLIYQGFLTSNTKLSKDTQKFAHKFALLKQSLNSEADGYKYYQTLVESLSAYGFEANLSKFSVNISRETSFDLIFTSYDEAISFLNLLENKSMIDKFDKLSLNSFDIAQKSDADYTVSLVGQFKNINATKSN